MVKIALIVSAARDLSLDDASRLMALMTMTLADTTIATVGTKFAHRHWRPAQAVPQADLDGNPLTVADATWRPRGGNAGSPEWLSGHSSYRGAAATVLAGFFCTDAIPFDLVTDSAPGGEKRSYRASPPRLLKPVAPGCLVACTSSSATRPASGSGTISQRRYSRNGCC